MDMLSNLTNTSDSMNLQRKTVNEIMLSAV